MQAVRDYSDFRSPAFADRTEAGALLAERLLPHRKEHALVLALPRGGVPVAGEIARRLDADLDVLVVRKLGAPQDEELAIGAVTADGTRYVNDALARTLGVSARYLAAITARESEIARQREKRLRAGRPKLDAKGRLVILVDDGLATGATMRAAIGSLRSTEPRKLIVAVPVGAADSCAEIEGEVDELVCIHRPQPFRAVGEYYRVFGQIGEEQVVDILASWRRSPAEQR